MSTTNFQLRINSSGEQQATGSEDEENHGRRKDDQEQLSRRRGVSAVERASRSFAESSPIQGRKCARCGGAFGRFYNTGASCPRCRHRVCRQCREFRGSDGANNKGEQRRSNDWLCAVCHKIAELRSATGEWIYETATLTNPRLVAAKKNSPVDIIKRSIRRAWTINGSPASWSVARKSPAFRIYRSLPVREKIHKNNIDDDEEDEDDDDDIEISSFSSPEASEIAKTTCIDDDKKFVNHRDIVEEKRSEKKNYRDEDFHEERAISFEETRVTRKIAISEGINLTRVEKIVEKKNEVSHDDLTSLELGRKKNERKNEQNDAVLGSSEISTQRVSLIKPPRVIAKIATNEIKQSPKHGDRKSNIPIFRRNSREFEDIGSPQEKRSLIPQRYRGSTDDLRRSREDISLPSLIPKLFSPRVKEQEKLKRQDSRDDIRQIPKVNRREIVKEENRREVFKDENRREVLKEENRSASFSSSYVREEQKSGIKIFRRESREDVGCETSSLPSLCSARGKQNFSYKDERQERNVEKNVGETITRSKSCPNEKNKISTRNFEKIEPKETIKIVEKIDSGTSTKIVGKIYLNESTKIVNINIDQDETTKINVSETKKKIIAKKGIFDIDQSERKNEEEVSIMANEMTMIEERLDENGTRKSCEENEKSLEKDEEEIENLEILETENLKVLNESETSEGIVESKEMIVDSCSETDFAGTIFGDRKLNAETNVGKRIDDVQVVRRKFSKEEFSNADDTDETPNRRSSSHLSPEASPLSTRSSRYSPRESESEPTPALPRKIGSGDSCTASQRIRDAITRTRRESNSSARYESSGSESVRLSESGLHGYADLARRVKLFSGGGNGPNPTLGNDEPVQRDSATSAGEDEPHEDCHSRAPGSSQGRTMLRRRRQFDAQGSRRRGRSHARTCCGEELQNLQALHVIGRGRHTSPTQEQQNPDYRRLVFISSDSSSGREEDDADSSCSGSSYLNGLPRNNHAQSLEDCDWDYFESGTLPLPSVGTETSINVSQVDNAIARDWNCCPGRGSAACLACGGSPGANVLPVPVPIPVPVPYPVPVPASLWTGDFAAAASSMITRGATPEGTLRLRGDPSAPWFSWHPRFNQPLHGARIDPRTAIGSFDPSVFNFRPEEISPRIYSQPVEHEALLSSPTIPIPETLKIPTNAQTGSPLDPQDVESTSVSPIVPQNLENLNESLEISDHNIKISEPEVQPEVPPEVEKSTFKELEEVRQINSNVNSEPEESTDDTEDSSESSREDDEEQRMYRNSREDSGSSSGRSSADSSDLEDSATHRFSRVFVVNDDSLTSENELEENEDSDSPREAVVTLKRVTSVPEIEPVVLRRVRLLDEDMNLQPESPDPRNIERRPNRIERRIDLLAERDPDANEIYLASSTDFSENQIQLKSIKNLNPENDEKISNVEKILHVERKNWESTITPDSLEIVDHNDSLSRNSEFIPEIIIPDDLEIREEPEMIDSLIDMTLPLSKNPQNEYEPEILPKSNEKIASQNSSSTTDSSETTTGSDPSSDELHEYEISPNDNSSQIHKNSPIFVSTPKNICSTIPKNLNNSDIPFDLETSNFGLKIETEGEKNVDDMISSRIESMFKNSASAHDESCSVRGDEKLTLVNQVGVSEVVDGGGNDGSSIIERGEATSRLSSVELSSPTRKDNGCFSSSTATKKLSNENNKTGKNFATSNNKYRSLVMITQGSYQPVSVVTSDTTTLLQPSSNENTREGGLAGYFHLALETSPQNGQTPTRRPPTVKRLVSSQEQEIDSGLSVGGSASESDDVQSVKNVPKVVKEITDQLKEQHFYSKSNFSQTSDAQSMTNAQNSADNEDRSRNFDYAREDAQSVRNLQKSIANEDLSRIVNSSEDAQSIKNQRSVGNEDRQKIESQSSDDNSGASGVVILEEGLADDDSWVEEVSHDEDETSATTATEESSEDEANNLGDREEELRGYHRQAIDFTLHTIVEESCEESETEPSITTSPRKKRPPSASELEKYFFFGLGGENSTASREIDSLSETSSIYSEGLESLNQDENSTNLENKGSNEFLNSSRLEKYFLSEFLGFDQDRRDSDGSVGSDSEGRPSPEAQRRKRLVRARGTGRSSHSSSLDNLLALAQGTQNLSSQNSLQDLSLAQDSQETQSEGSSTETDGADDGNATQAFGTDGQFDTVKRKKKKPRTLGTQSPRVPEDKTPEPRDGATGEMENEIETGNSDDERAKTPQPENSLHSSSSSSSSSSQIEARGGSQASSSDSSRGKQQSRDSGFVGSCDDLLQSQKPSPDGQSTDANFEASKDSRHRTEGEKRRKSPNNLQPPPNASLSRKDSFNNWSSDEETNLMMSKMRQFFKTMVANTNGQAGNSSGASPAPSPRLSGYSRTKISSQNRTKPPQLVYFENELTRLMKTVPGIRDEQVREIVEYLSSEDTWSDSYDSSDYTSSDLEGAAGGRRSALQEQISQSCQQIIDKFDTNLSEEKKETPEETSQPCLGRDTAFVYQKLVQSFTKIAADAPSAETSSAHAHSSPPLIAKVMHHIGSRLVALMHEVSEGGTQVQPPTWRRYSQHHHRTPSSASTTEDDDSTSDSTNPPSSHLPRSKSHDPLLLINGHPTNLSGGQEGEEREASDYERFSWRGSFESALMAADSRTKLSLLACSGDVSACASASALAMAAKRRSAGDLLFNPKSFSREQLDRVRSCGSIGGGGGGGSGGGVGGSIEEKIWSNRRRSSVPDANTRGESGASAGDDDTEDELEYGGDSRATTLPRGMQSTTGASAATNSLPRLPASTAGAGISSAVNSSTPIHKAHSVYHFLPQHTGVKSARYRPPGFARNSLGNAGGNSGPKRAVSAPGLQATGNQTSGGKRENSRSRRQQQAISLTPDDGSSLSEACSTPIIGAGSRAVSSNTVMDIDEMDRGLHSGHLATRASLSSLGARSDSMASVYSGAGEGRWCGSVAVRGEVEFSLQYDYKQLTFEVHVTQCKDLAPVDIKRNRSDPYVKVYLLPDKSKSGKRKTKVKKHTLNPVFDETLKFHMSLNGLETRTLWLTVWHSDMFGRNDFLGEVRMPLENKIFDDPTPRWYPLQERTEPFDDPIAYKGEVIVGLKFVPPDPAQLERERDTSIENRGLSKGRKNWSRGSLHVLVKEARNLQTRAKNSGTCDPFCKSYLLPDKGRSGKQKTGVVRRSGGSPVWGHTFVYKDVSLQELAERGLELTVWDHDRIASNEFLGGVRFNLGSGKHYGKLVDWMDATGRELSLWQSMLERPNFWVEGAVTLRPNLHNHGKNGGA